MVSSGHELLARLYPPGEVHRFTLAHQGIEYGGEVVLLDRWDPSWGEPLEGDSYFRIVLLTQSGRVSQESIGDSRIAVCVPSRSSARGQGTIQRELTTIAETRALYHTGATATGRVIHKSLERQQRELEEKLLEEEGARYASGDIVSPTTLPSPHRDIFAGADPACWFERLAHHLLAWAYSTSPLEWNLLPRAISPADVPRICDALFSTGAIGPLEQLGPGLGLCNPETPGVYGPGQIWVLHHIRLELEKSKGSVDAQALHLGLAHGLGLTRDLATLFLLAFVHSARPEAHLSLMPDHGIAMRNGRPLRGRLLTPELVSSISWERALPEKFAALHAPTSLIWNDTLAHTSLLCEELTEIEEGEDPSSQEGRLLYALDSLVKEVLRAEEALAGLRRAVKGTDASGFEEGLERLSRVCEAGGHVEVYNLARHLYGGPGGLLEDIGRVTRLLELEPTISGIGYMGSYLEEALVPAQDAQLSFERTSLERQLSLADLLEHPHALDILEAGFERFRKTYCQWYVIYHRQYHADASSLAASLEACRQKLEALGMLDTVPELGEPAGPELVARFDAIGGPIASCRESLDESALAKRPLCPSCRLTLEDRLSDAEAHQLFQDLEQALGEKNRRLSRLLARRILAGRVDQRLDSFLKIVQSSDLTALANTLDADLVSFIRGLLR